MDTNSKVSKLEQITKEEGFKEFIENIKKFKWFKKVFFIILFITMIAMIVLMKNKQIAILLSLFIIISILYVKNLMNDFKDIALFQEFFEITNICEDSQEIFERTNLNTGLEHMLGKSYKKILDNLYEVEKYIHKSILKGKQNENMSNELVVEVSKNLKNPVGNIEEYVEKLENLDENYLYNIEKLESESNLLKHNIEELFELSKAITKTVELDIREVDIKSLLKQGLVEYSDKLESKNLKIKTNMDESKIIIKVDGQQMWRVLEILLDNVVKYSKENSRVYLNLNQDINNKNVTISLINISKEELNIDKEEFLKNIRKDKSVNKMGLAIASNLISIQNGNLDIFIDGDMFKVDIVFKTKSENEN